MMSAANCKEAYGVYVYNFKAHANYMPLFNNEGYKEIYKRVTFTKCAVLFNDNFRLVLENICILAIF